MSKFQGTKGRWLIDKLSDYEKSTSNCITCEKGWTEDSKWIANVYVNHLGVDKNEGIANTKLISKAPEMLEMLEWIASGQYIDKSEIQQLIKESTEL